MNNRILTLIAAIALSILPGISQAGDGHNHAEHADAGKPQAKCPILGGAINKDVFVDYQGKRIYFCCPGCDKKFLANADELIKKIEADGVKLDAAPAAAEAEATEAAAPAPQAMCPVSNEPIDESVFVMHGGQKVFFCCKMCRGKFKKSPETYLKKMQEGEAAAPAAEADGHAGHDHGNHQH